MKKETNPLIASFERSFLGEEDGVLQIKKNDRGYRHPRIQEVYY